MFPRSRSFVLEDTVRQLTTSGDDLELEVRVTIKRFMDPLGQLAGSLSRTAIGLLVSYRRYRARPVRLN